MTRIPNKRELTMKWARTIGKYLSHMVGAVGGIFAIFGRDNVKGYLEQYLPIFIVVALIIVLYVWVGYVVWQGGREIWRGIRGWNQKRRDSRQLRQLAVNISEIRQLVGERQAHSLRDTDDVVAYLYDVSARLAPLRDKLAELCVSTPEYEIEGMYQNQIHLWATYLDLLLPLAVIGDIKEARMVMSRIKASPKA